MLVEFIIKNIENGRNAAQVALLGQLCQSQLWLVFLFIHPQFGFHLPSALLPPETLKFEVSEIEHVLVTILYETSKFWRPRDHVVDRGRILTIFLVHPASVWFSSPFGPSAARNLKIRGVRSRAFSFNSPVWNEQFLKAAWPCQRLN